MELFEQACRFYIISETLFAGADSFDPGTNFEQLNKQLVSLRLAYAVLKRKGLPTPNEAEFAAYTTVAHIPAQARPNPYDEFRHFAALLDPGLNYAARLLAAFEDTNWLLFFDLARNAPPLLGALTNRYLDTLRRRALMRLCTTGSQPCSFSPSAPKAGSNKFFLTDLTRTMLFDDEEHCYRYLSHFIREGFLDHTAVDMTPGTRSHSPARGLQLRG